MFISIPNTTRPIPNGAAWQIFFPASGIHVVQNIYSLTVMICNHAANVTAIGATLQSLCMVVHCSEYQRQQTARLACLTGVHPHLVESSSPVMFSSSLFDAKMCFSCNLCLRKKCSSWPHPGRSAVVACCIVDTCFHELVQTRCLFLNGKFVLDVSLISSVNHDYPVGHLHLQVWSLKQNVRIAAKIMYRFVYFPGEGTIKQHLKS